SSAPASSGAPSELPHSGAPAVHNPLPESVVSGDPCQALTPEQVKTALGDGVSQGQRSDVEELGARCRWSHSSNQSAITVGFQTETGQGLSAVYANTQPRMPVFNEIDPIEGYPAVEFKESDTDPMCTTMVGIADEYAISVSGTLGADAEQEGKDSCKPGQQVASWVVANLKAQS
ncbi:hypothetical protein ACZ91_66915, partial [Streptomyces regensis]